MRRVRDPDIFSSIGQQDPRMGAQWSMTDPIHVDADSKKQWTEFRQLADDMRIQCENLVASYREGPLHEQFPHRLRYVPGGVIYGSSAIWKVYQFADATWVPPSDKHGRPLAVAEAPSQLEGSRYSAVPETLARAIRNHFLRRVACLELGSVLLDEMEHMLRVVTEGPFCDVDPMARSEDQCTPGRFRGGPLAAVPRSPSHPAWLRAYRRLLRSGTMLQSIWKSALEALEHMGTVLDDVRLGIVMEEGRRESGRLFHGALETFRSLQMLAEGPRESGPFTVQDLEARVAGLLKDRAVHEQVDQAVQEHKQTQRDLRDQALHQALQRMPLTPASTLTRNVVPRLLNGISRQASRRRRLRGGRSKGRSRSKDRIHRPRQSHRRKPSKVTPRPLPT